VLTKQQQIAELSIPQTEDTTNFKTKIEKGKFVLLRKVTLTVKPEANYINLKTGVSKVRIQ